MKRISVGILLFIFAYTPNILAAEAERYQYNQDQQLVFDSAAGKIYRFIRDDDTIKHVEIDFVSGIIKIDGAIRSSGTFDYRDLDKEVIVAKV